MNSRQLAILGAVTAAIILAAIWIGMPPKPAAPSNAALYPQLKGQLQNVTAVKTFAAGDTLAVQATRTKDGWTIEQRHDYPGDTAKINGLLLGLEDAKLHEEKTGNPDNYATLGVEDLAKEKSGDHEAARVELAGVAPTVNLIVGKTDATRAGSYVRRVGEKQSWLLDKQLAVPTDPTKWLRRDLLNIAADRIHEAEVAIVGERRYDVVKAKRDDTNFDVTPIPRGRELNSVAAPNGIAQTLVNLQLDDVQPAASLADKKGAAQTTFRTFDGLALDLTGYEIDGKYWITVKPSVDEALAKRYYIPPPAPDKSKDKAEDKGASKNDDQGIKPVKDHSLEEALSMRRDEVAAIAKQTSDWAYELPQYKYEAIFKPLEQLLKKPESFKKKK